MQTPTIKRVPVPLSANDWNEIYYALIDKMNTPLVCVDAAWKKSLYQILDNIGTDGRKAWDSGTQGNALIPEGISQAKRQELRELLWPYLTKDGAAADKRQTGRGTKTFSGLIDCILSIIFEEN